MSKPGAGRGPRNSSSDLPAPLVPPECTTDGYPMMMVDIVRLRQSDFYASCSDPGFRAAFNMWMSAFQSKPAGSLKDSPATLMRAADIGRDAALWESLKAEAMYGFVLCSDGRYYHPTVCIQALNIYIDKLIRRRTSQKANNARHGTPIDSNIAVQVMNARNHLAALDQLASGVSKAENFCMRHETQEAAE